MQPESVSPLFYRQGPGKKADAVGKKYPCVKADEVDAIVDKPRRDAHAWRQGAEGDIDAAAH